jgi:long-chain acyl-CoA synthetase
MVSTSPVGCQTRNDPRVFGDPERTAAAPDGDLEELVEQFRGATLDPVELGRDDVALLTYTSGTTGPPKGAMNTHGNLLAVTSSFAAWIDLRPGDVVFAMAPLFHITGSVINATIAMLNDAVLVMANRFHPEVATSCRTRHGGTSHP